MSVLKVLALVLAGWFAISVGLVAALVAAGTALDWWRERSETRRFHDDVAAYLAKHAGGQTGGQGRDVNHRPR